VHAAALRLEQYRQLGCVCTMQWCNSVSCLLGGRPDNGDHCCTTLAFAWTVYIAQSLLQLVVKLVAETIALCTHHGSNTYLIGSVGNIAIF